MGAAVRYIGQIEKSPMESVMRVESYGESKVCETEITGIYDDLENQIIPGCRIPQQYLKTISGSDYFVKEVTLSREDGNVGVAHVKFVKCASPTEPYSVTFEVAMEAVTMNLISHPKIQEDEKALEEIQRLEAMMPEERIEKESEFTSEMAKKYIAANKAGITTYNKYLPIVRKTSLYLRLPGGLYNADGQCTGGTILVDGIGKFGSPMILVSGAQGDWLKSRDTFSLNSDGSATRNEEWTLSDDTKHKWIYE